MGDWEIVKPASASGVSIDVVSPGYNSQYCLLISISVDAYVNGFYGLRNVAYSSDAFMAVFQLKINQYTTIYNYSFQIGTTSYGRLDIKNYRIYYWAKHRFVGYYNSNIGYAVLSLEKWDSDNNTWTPVASKIITSVQNPKVGMFEIGIGYGSSSGLGKVADIYIDNIELYTGKSIYISKIVSEAIEKVIGTS